MITRKQALAELHSILNYWSTVAFDRQRDRFYGQINDNNLVNHDAPIGSVLYARILWSFSAAFRITANPLYLAMADKSFAYLTGPLSDKELGGVFWSVDANSQPLDTKKQIYAQAFAIYGLAEYYRITNKEEALNEAVKLFGLIEKHSFDPKNLGYLEAFDRNWIIAGDLRLSSKDDNCKKTMNTHLHVLEAYTNLYRVWPDEFLALQITQLIAVFNKYIIDPNNLHLQLFFDENWNSHSKVISYGHDIEASWLIFEAAEVLKEDKLTEDIAALAVKMAVAAAEGLAKDGGMNYEYDPISDHLITEKHWWVQTEAMVGFYNAWQLSGNSAFLEQFKAAYNFTDQYILDKEYGEWHWGVYGDHSLMKDQDKAGIWKCPYHNSRSCIELIRRISD